MDSACERALSKHVLATRMHARSQERAMLWQENVDHISLSMAENAAQVVALAAEAKACVLAATPADCARVIAKWDTAVSCHAQHAGGRMDMLRRLRVERKVMDKHARAAKRAFVEVRECMDKMD